MILSVLTRLGKQFVKMFFGRLANWSAVGLEAHHVQHLCPEVAEVARRPVPAAGQETKLIVQEQHTVPWGFCWGCGRTIKFQAAWNLPANLAGPVICLDCLTILIRSADGELRRPSSAERASIEARGLGNHLRGSAKKARRILVRQNFKTN